MARARNIKPGLFKNEILGVADPLYTLLFEGLWLLADREGRLEDRPLRIKAEIFPYREGLDVVAMLSWLETQGFILRYSSNGLALIQILQFAKHQSPHKNEVPSTLPAPSDGIGRTSEEIGTTRPDSGFLIPDSGLIETPPPAPAAPPPPSVPKKSKPTATAMPEGFGISDRVRTWAKEKGYGQLDQHLEAFTAKCRAKAYTYASWDDAFMEAIREDWAKLRGKAANGAAPPPEPKRHDTAADTRRMLEQQTQGTKPPDLATLQKLAELRKAA
jgi:hypothetical protein